MKKTIFTESQIIGMLKEQEQGKSVGMEITEEK